MNFVIRHPPRATVARSQVGTALVFAEPFDKVIALADVKAAGANALEDVDEVHVKKMVGTTGFEPATSCAQGRRSNPS